MKFKDYLENVVNVLLLIGLIVFSFGIVSWSLKLMREYGVSLEVVVAFIGVFLMVIGYAIAKIFSKN